MSAETRMGDVERIRDFIDQDESQGHRRFTEATDSFIRVATVIEAALDWAHRYEACSTESGEEALHHAVTLLAEWRYPRPVTGDFRAGPQDGSAAAESRNATEGEPHGG